MQIRFINSVSSAVGSFAAGSEADLSPEDAQGFVACGHAEFVVREERAVVDKPVEKATKGRK